MDLPFHLETRLAQWVRIFLNPLNSKDYFFSHIPILRLGTYCIICVGDVTELMFTVNGASYFKTKISHFEIAITQHFKQCTNAYLM